MKPTKAKRGFASMHPATLHSVCSAGGVALVAKHGPKHMARIGRKGGKK